MTPIALLRDVLRLQIGDCWAWCQLFSDVVFTNPGPSAGPGMASTSSSRAAPRSAHARMLCYGTLRGCAARRIARAQRLGSRADFFTLLVSLQSASSHSNNFTLFHGLHAQNSLFKAVNSQFVRISRRRRCAQSFGPAQAAQILLQLSHCRCRRSELDTVRDTLPTRTN